MVQQLFGVQSQLEHVVQQSEQGAQRECGREQSDKTVLQHWRPGREAKKKKEKKNNFDTQLLVHGSDVYGFTHFQIFG